VNGNAVRTKSTTPIATAAAKPSPQPAILRGVVIAPAYASRGWQRQPCSAPSHPHAGPQLHAAGEAYVALAWLAWQPQAHPAPGQSMQLQSRVSWFNMVRSLSGRL
jgi:hypothetical protein